jgi:hypothetical protein
VGQGCAGHLRRHGITDPAAQGQQGDHEGEEKMTHVKQNNFCSGNS